MPVAARGAALALALLVTGCNPGGTAFQLGVPGASDVCARVGGGEALEVLSEGPGFSGSAALIRALGPADAAP